MGALIWLQALKHQMQNIAADGMTLNDCNHRHIKDRSNERQATHLPVTFFSNIRIGVEKVQNANIVMHHDAHKRSMHLKKSVT